MRPRLLAAIVGVTVLLGGCGGSSGGNGAAGKPQPTQAASNAGHPWREAKLRRLMGIRRETTTAGYQLSAHPECVTTSLLRSTAEVQDYRTDGAAVLTNPGASAGVSAEGLSPSCRRLFSQALANVR